MDDFNTDISNEETDNILLPVCHHILHDPAHYERLISILDNIENDIRSAAIAAFFHNQPSIIEVYRENSSPNDDYISPMAAIIRKIVSDKKIMKWCRGAGIAPWNGYASTTDFISINILSQQSIFIIF